MSIPSAQMTLFVIGSASATPADRSTRAATPPAAAVASSSQSSTDMRVDAQHQVYYEFVDNRTGNVLFEIPPEAFRAIGESLNVPLAAEANGLSVDVKS